MRLAVVIASSCGCRLGKEARSMQPLFSQKDAGEAAGLVRFRP